MTSRAVVGELRVEVVKWNPKIRVIAGGRLSPLEAAERPAHSESNNIDNIDNHDDNDNQRGV